MVIQQPGARTGTERPGSAPAQEQQMTASQSDTTAKAPAFAPGFAAFGTTGGAAIMFRDLASI